MAGSELLQLNSSDPCVYQGKEGITALWAVPLSAVSYAGCFWEVLFCCSCSFRYLCESRIKISKKKPKTEKILWSHFLHRFILLSNTPLDVYGRKGKCRWLHKAFFLPLVMMVLVLPKNLFVSSALIYGALVVMKRPDCSYSVVYLTWKLQEENIDGQDE